MNDARAQILGAVRRALGPARQVPDIPSRAPVRGGGGRAPVSTSAMRDLFVRRAEDYRATVTRGTAQRLPAILRTALAGSRRTVVPGALTGATRRAVDLVPGVLPDTGEGAGELDRLDAVLTTASLAVAETGTLVLEHRGGQGRRALSLVPDLHVCVLASERIVPDVPAAVAALDPEVPQTWISGPSATSDIELERVEGVHGPRSLHIVLVDPG